MVIGIDPSFTSTGIAVMECGKLLYSTRVSSDIKIYESITQCQKAANVILQAVKHVVNSYPEADVIVEYPALATKSGAYLAILHGYLSSFLNENVEGNVVYVPPTACDSYTKNHEHSKSFLVQYVKDKGYVERRVQQDIATAIIFCELYHAIQSGKYMNKSFKYE